MDLQQLRAFQVQIPSYRAQRVGQTVKIRQAICLKSMSPSLTVDLVDVLACEGEGRVKSFAAMLFLPIAQSGKQRRFLFRLSFDDDTVTAAGQLEDVDALRLERLADGPELLMVSRLVLHTIGGRPVAVGAAAEFPEHRRRS